MSVNSASFPHCCTAKVLAGFDQTHIADLGSSYAPDREHIKNMVLKKEDYHRTCGDAILVATLNSDQTVAAEVLEELGWETSGFGHSGKHTTRVSLWFKVLRPESTEEQE